jgi:hypothetical protein
MAKKKKSQAGLQRAGMIILSFPISYLLVSLGLLLYKKFYFVSDQAFILLFFIILGGVDTFLTILFTREKTNSRYEKMLILAWCVSILLAVGLMQLT